MNFRKYEKYPFEVLLRKEKEFKWSSLLCSGALLGLILVDAYGALTSEFEVNYTYFIVILLPFNAHFWSEWRKIKKEIS